MHVRQSRARLRALAVTHVPAPRALAAGGARQMLEGGLEESGEGRPIEMLPASTLPAAARRLLSKRADQLEALRTFRRCVHARDLPRNTELDRLAAPGRRRAAAVRPGLIVRSPLSAPWRCSAGRPRSDARCGEKVVVACRYAARNPGAANFRPSLPSRGRQLPAGSNLP